MSALQRLRSRILSYTIKEHALNMASRRCLRAGGEVYVTSFEFDIDAAKASAKTRVFEHPSEEWAEFVMMNRNKKLLQPAHDYDIVVGPVADDSVAMSFRLFKDNFISISELAKRLQYKELSIQYFFHTEKSLTFLKIIE